MFIGEVDDGFEAVSEGAPKFVGEDLKDIKGHLDELDVAGATDHVLEHIVDIVA